MTAATLEEIAVLLTRLIDVRTFDMRLWDNADVATFLKLHPDHVRKFIVTRSDFPAAVDLPGKGKDPIRRYRPVDVRDWAEKFRG